MSDSSLNTGPVKRGKLTVYLGYAAGTGKTYQMLLEAGKLREAGADIVIGYFEPHARKETIAKTEGLETIPRSIVSYKGCDFFEMDVDAVLARRPAICIVDEYAHSNVPGSTRTKRWQDVEKLRDAGMDVLTTLNVQHIESLNDYVWQITGVRVRETVPDWVVGSADELVMVDVTPRALIHRLERGVVYAPDKAQSALSNFFSEANLAALRELAMRQTAHQVEERREEPTSLSPVAAGARTQEKVLLLVTEDPSTAGLIRRARRVADYLQGECHALFVGTDRAWSTLSAQQRSAVERHLGFAESLRIQTKTVAGADMPRTLVSFAHQMNITQLFVCRSAPELMRIVQLATGMEVTVVADRTRPV